MTFHKATAYNNIIIKPSLEETKMKVLECFAIMLCSIVPFTNPATAVERHVPSDYSTIQAAINACNNGDIVIIATGTYTGTGNRDIDFKGKSLIVRGETGDPNDCIIDCQGDPNNLRRGFKFVSGENANSVLEAVTVTNGYAPKESIFRTGGAVFCDKSSPTISNCIFSNNSAVYLNDNAWGGAVSNFNNSNPRIENCTFTDNISNNYGGGISDYNSCRPTIINCNFTNNRAYYGGGGVFNYIDSSPIITDCNFIANSSDYHGTAIENLARSNSIISNCVIKDNSGSYGGGAIFNSYSNSTISNCIILNNSNSWSGGIYNFGSSPYINNCVINHNLGFHSTGTGGISNDYNSSPIIKNCVINNNLAIFCGGIRNMNNSIPVIINSIIWGNVPTQISDLNTVVSYSDIQGGYAGTGNINAEPLFAGDGFHLTGVSPCIDAGDPNTIIEPNETDIDGEPRIVGGRIDMGADEFSCIGDFNNDNNVDFIDFAILAGSWQQNDPLRNIAPPDNIIDIEDLSAFCDNWLGCQ